MRMAMVMIITAVDGNESDNSNDDNGMLNRMITAIKKIPFISQLLVETQRNQWTHGGTLINNQISNAIVQFTFFFAHFFVFLLLQMELIITKHIFLFNMANERVGEKEGERQVDIHTDWHTSLHYLQSCHTFPCLISYSVFYRLKMIGKQLSIKSFIYPSGIIFYTSNKLVNNSIKFHTFLMLSFSYINSPAANLCRGTHRRNFVLIFDMTQNPYFAVCHCMTQ